MKRTVSTEDLREARAHHLKELRLLRRMSDEQFQAFKRNFSLAQADPAITRRRAIEMLQSMLETNLALERVPEEGGDGSD